MLALLPILMKENANLRCFFKELDLSKCGMQCYFSNMEKVTMYFLTDVMYNIGAVCIGIGATFAFIWMGNVLKALYT
jgi:hypothetical protein